MAMTNINDIFYAFDNPDATSFNLSGQKIYDKLGIKDTSAFKMKKL